MQESLSNICFVLVPVRFYLLLFSVVVVGGGGAFYLSAPRFPDTCFK